MFFCVWHIIELFFRDRWASSHARHKRVGAKFGDILRPDCACSEEVEPICCRRMKASLEADLRRLSRLAFRRTEKTREVVREFYLVKKKIRDHDDFTEVECLYQWLFTPLTLWPVDVAGLMTHMLRKMTAGAALDAKAKLLMRLL